MQFFMLGHRVGREQAVIIYLFLKNLAEKLSRKDGEPYAIVRCLRRPLGLLIVSSQPLQLLIQYFLAQFVVTRAFHGVWYKFMVNRTKQPNTALNYYQRRPVQFL